STQASQHLESIQPWQADVKNGQGVILTDQGVRGDHPVVQNVHGQAAAAQGLGHTLGQGQVVFDQQDSHRGSTPQPCDSGASLTAGSRPCRRPSAFFQTESLMKGWFPRITARVARATLKAPYEWSIRRD